MLLVVVTLLQEYTHSVSKQCYNISLKNKEVRGIVEILSNQESGKRRVLQAGERLLLILLGGKTEKNLDELRGRKYYEKNFRAYTPSN